MRINSHQVIQLVGDDKLVFVEEYRDIEVVLPISQVALIMESFDKQRHSQRPDDVFGFHEGDNNNPGEDFVDFYWSEWDMVDRAVNYLVAASKVPLDEQMAQTKVVSFDNVEDALDFMSRWRNGQPPQS